jgi:hypothetical protein
MRPAKKASSLGTGFLFGAILAVILLALDLLPFIPITYVGFQIVAIVADVILSLWAGLHIASRSGSARDGVVAGTVTGLIGALAYIIDVRIVILVFYIHENLGSLISSLPYVLFYVANLTYALIGGAVGLVAGAIGGAIGSGRA